MFRSVLVILTGKTTRVYQVGNRTATAPQPVIHVLLQVWGGFAVAHLDDGRWHKVEVDPGNDTCWAQSVIWHLGSASVATLESFDIYFVISRKSADVDKSVKIVENLLSLVMDPISLCSACVRRPVRPQGCTILPVGPTDTARLE